MDRWEDDREKGFAQGAHFVFVWRLRDGGGRSAEAVVCQAES